MRYRRAVEKVRVLAEACESVKVWPSEEPFLLEAYVFGRLLDGADPLEFVEVALVLNLPPAEVPWESRPPGTAWLEEQLRLDKGGFDYRWRSHLSLVPNHHIREPVRFWSRQGPDEAVFQALAERRFDELPRLVPAPEAIRELVAEELATALDRLRAVHASYWDQQWRREHRGFGRYPEQHLWEAVHGYLDLVGAAESAG